MLDRLSRKRKNQKGESLLETLTALLIAALSIAILLSGIVAAERMNAEAGEVNAVYAEALRNAEKREGTPDISPISGEEFRAVIGNGTVTKDIPINIYGGKGMYSY